MRDVLEVLKVLEVLEGVPLSTSSTSSTFTMTRAGLEPATYGLKVRCSTN